MSDQPIAGRCFLVFHPWSRWSPPYVEQETKIVTRDGVEIHRSIVYTGLVQEKTCARCGRIRRRRLEE